MEAIGIFKHKSDQKKYYIKISDYLKYDIFDIQDIKTNNTYPEYKENMIFIEEVIM